MSSQLFTYFTKVPSAGRVISYLLILQKMGSGIMLTRRDVVTQYILSKEMVKVKQMK
jgi:hypothetical protein